TLSAANTYTGATTVSGGTLNVNAINSAATTTVANNATLNVNNQLVQTQLTNDGTTTLAAGSTSTVGTVEGTTAASVLSLGTNATLASNHIRQGGAFALQGASPSSTTKVTVNASNGGLPVGADSGTSHVRSLAMDNDGLTVKSYYATLDLKN